MEEVSLVGICISTRDLLQWICSDMQNGDTALICAAASDRCHVVTELISLGADVDFQDNVSIQDTGKWFRFIECTVCYSLKCICIHLSAGSACVKLP